MRRLARVWLFVMPSKLVLSLVPLSGRSFAAEDPTVVTVPANPQWIETPISLAEGDTFSIAAGGAWSVDTCRTAPFGSSGMIELGLNGDNAGFISTSETKGALIGAIIAAAIVLAGLVYYFVGKRRSVAW